MRVLSFSTTFVRNISHSKKIERDTIQMFCGLHVQYLFFLSDFNETWNFFERFSKNTQISTLMKIRSVGAQLFHGDGQRDSRPDRHN